MSDSNSSNGVPTSLADIRAERELLEEQLKLQSLKNKKFFADKRTTLLEHWGDWWDRDYYPFAGGGELYSRVRGRDETDQPRMPPSVLSDRRGGDDWPIFRNLDELLRLRNASRTLCAYNGYARALLLNMTNYVIGNGFIYNAVSTELVPDADVKSPGKQDPKAVKQLERIVQDFVDDFTKRNFWMLREREIYRRVLRDGEAFLRLFFRDDGRTVVRPVEPEQVRDPYGSDYRDGWSYGMQHQVSPTVDVETILQYYVMYQDPTAVLTNGNTELGDLVPAVEMVHIKNPESDAAVKRGLPAFYGDTLNAFYRASTLQRNISIGAAVRQSIGMIWQYAFGTEAQISEILADNKEYRRTDPVTGRTENVQRRAAGETIHVPEGQQIGKHPGSDAAVSDHMQGVQGDLRLGSSAFAAPEYITGSAEHANFASSLVASAPFVRNAESQQEYMSLHFLEVINRAIKHGIDKGLLPREAATLVEISIDPPKVIHKDMMQQASVDQVLVMLGAKDRQTVCSEWTYDWEQVKANNMEWEEIHGAFEQTIPGIQQMGRGIGGGAGMGMKPPGGMGEGVGAGQRMDTMESLLEAEWEEEKHPRAEGGKFSTHWTDTARTAAPRLAKIKHEDTKSAMRATAQAGGSARKHFEAAALHRKAAEAHLAVGHFNISRAHQTMALGHDRGYERFLGAIESDEALEEAGAVKSGQFSRITGQDVSEAESFFADCQRDELGHCKPGGGVEQKPGEKASELQAHVGITGKTAEERISQALVIYKSQYNSAHPDNPSYSHEQVDQALTQLNALRGPEIAKVLDEVGIFGRFSKAEAIAEIGRKIKSRWEFHSRMKAPESLQEAAGTCKQGERSDLTGCSPETNETISNSGGEPSNSDKPTSTPDKPKGTLGKLGAKVSEMADRVPVLKSVKAGIQSVMKGIHAKLESRYGTKVANTIMASGAVGGFGVAAGIAVVSAGLLPTGIPVVNDLVSILAHTAIAEVGYRLGFIKGKVKEALVESEEQFDDETMKQIAADMRKEIQDALRKLLAQHKDELAGLEHNEEVKALVGELKGLRESAALERCVRKVEMQGDVDSPWAVCQASLHECAGEPCEEAECPLRAELREAEGTCKPGERADLTGCTPASGEVSSLPAT